MKNFLPLIFILSVLLSSCNTNRGAKSGMPFTTFSIINTDTASPEYVSPLNNVNLQLDLYNKDVRFYAFSNGRWNLELYSDSILFGLIIPAHGTFLFPFAEAVMVQKPDAIHYYSSINEQHDTIDITIRKQDACEDKMNGVDYPFTVIILLKGHGKEITYTGCGFYLANPILNDIWALDSVNGKAVDRSAYVNGVPTLEFHLDGTKVYGFAGCNHITGSFYIDRNNTLILSKTIATLMACESMNGEITFLNAVNNKGYTYSLANRRLTLMQKGGTTLVFKKVD